MEPIKILTEGRTRPMPQIHNRRVVTTNLPTLGTNLKQSQSRSTTQEAKDLVVLQITRRTVRKAGADGPQALGGQSATRGGQYEKGNKTSSTAA
jgi:hypothetical protein